MKQHIAVAISGGIDSLYTAHHLIQSGHEVTGIHFITGYGGFPEIPAHPDGRVVVQGNPDQRTVSAMSCLSARLGIPIHILDLTDLFENLVVHDFVAQYQNGKTPNPCLVCNPGIKFGRVLYYALSLGADRLATGHYARVETDSGLARLYKGLDTTKDQSYFLAFLNQTQLKRALFPLGRLSKADIVEKAKAAGLAPLIRKESQDVCFIHDDYKAFLLSRSGFRHENGEIRTTDGKKVGTHTGLHSFTIGQRRGINCPAAFPYYVIRLDTESNTLVVGSKDELLSDRLSVRNPSWIQENSPDFPLTALTRIRYSHKGVPATVHRDDQGTLDVTCHEPVLSVTPGQGAVFYREDEVLGAGWIV